MDAAATVDATSTSAPPAAGAAEPNPSPSPAPSPSPLFRPDAMKRLSSPDRLDVAARVVKPFSWVLLATTAVVLVTALVASVLVRVPVKVEAEGILLSPTGVRDIGATSAGQLKALLVRIGDHVAEGDGIAQIEQPDLKQEIELANAELREAREQLRQSEELQARAKAVQDELRNRQRASTTSSIGFAEKRIQLIKERLTATEDLAAKGFAPRQKVLDIQVELGSANEELNKLRSQMQQLEVEETSAANDREREKLAAQTRSAVAERKLQQLQARLGRFDVVKSPYTGVVAELKVNEGELIERGGSLLTLIPDSGTGPVNGSAGGRRTIPLVATLYVPPQDGKRIQNGMTVQIMPAGIKREEDGFAKARVSSISTVPATQEGMTRVLKNAKLVQGLAAMGAPFEVKAALDLDPATPTGFEWSTPHGPDGQLTVGTPCKAEIVVRLDPVLTVMFPSLRRTFEVAP